MKIKTLLLLSASALMLASCGGNENKDSEKKGDESSQVTPPSSETSNDKESSAGDDVSSDESQKEEKSSESAGQDDSSEPRPAEKANLFYQDGDILIGQGETAMSNGQIGCWFGDGGKVTAFTHANGKYSLSYAAAGQWYGVQVFYKLPYSVAGDSYHIETTFHSDTAGTFTINNETITVEANTDYSYSKDFTTTSATVISMQLGVNGTSVMGGSLLTFTDPVIKDNGDNKYHKVAFKNGDVAVKEIQVRDGKTVKAPADPTAPEGQIFDGWYDGETKFSPDAVISSPKTYIAKFADASSSKKVTFKTADGKVLKEIDAVSGKTITAPTDISIYAYSIVGWLTTEGAPFDFATPISDDLTLIAKTQISPTTYFNAADTGYVIPSQHCSVTDEGAYKVSGLAPYKSDSWMIQVNFAPIPADEAKEYTISFAYMVNSDKAKAQVFSGTTYGNVLLLTKSTAFQTASITFTGPLGEGDKKLTFELGAIDDVETIEFQVKDVVLTSK